MGAGGNTRLRHLPGFAQIEGVELAAVANRTVESARKAAGEFSITTVRESWREIVADPDIDAVCIGTWPDTHAEMTLAALAAGKHVLVEARMARTLAEAEAMASAADRHADLVAQIVPAPFTLDVDDTISRALAAGQIGELREVVVEHRSGMTADASLPLGWRMDGRISGVNTMALGICYEPLLRWIPGDVSVTAADAAVFTRRRNTGNGGEPRDVVIPESLTVLGRWANGARLVLHQSSVEHGPAQCRYRMVGSEAVLHFDAMAQELTRVGADGESVPVEFTQNPIGGWRVEAQFVDSIRRGTPVTLTNFQTGVRYMKFTEAVWRTWSAAGADA